jgi:hypothetical protein
MLTCIWAARRQILLASLIVGSVLYWCHGWILPLASLIIRGAALLVGGSLGLLVGSIWDGRQDGRIMPDWPSNLGLLLGCATMVYVLP